MKRLGERIKQKRESLNFQLNELAKKVGISSSALSQIEKGKALPTITNLKLIAECLHTTVGELIGENEALTNNPRVKFDEISFIEENESGCSSHLLSFHGPNKHMDTLLLKFLPNSNSEGIIHTHPGQTFLFILDGELVIELDGEKYFLSTKDSFYFNSKRNHNIKNESEEEASLILVATPPMA